MSDIAQARATADHNALARAAPSLPAEWYYDEAHHRREVERIWQRRWLYAGHRSSLAEARAFRTTGSGARSIVLLRARDGTLRAFHNVCRHRGSLLCREPAGRLPGDHLVCPYHQWSYDADSGALLRISSFTEPEGFRRDDHPLFRAAVAEWRGFVFVHPDPGARWDPKAEFQRATEGFDNFPLEDLVVAETWRTVIECNWKTFWEQFRVAIHNHTHLSNAEKLAYLRHSLKDGTAKNVIAGLSHFGDHYSEAIECLTTRYDRPRLIHQAHVRKISEISHLKDGSEKELRYLHELAS